MKNKPTIVSASFEVMLGQGFHNYAGGLGVVQAGLMKSAGRSDWPVNMYGLGILWQEGYYEQKIGPDGMAIDYVGRHYPFLEDTGVKVKVAVNGRDNSVKVWYLPPEVFKTAPMFFLDTNLEENDDLARLTTRRLYGGNEQTRLAQEIVLGIGGVRAFEALGISVDKFHGHEGNCLLLAAELFKKNRDWQATKKQFVYTTHTPEMAGNEQHMLDLMMEMGCFPGLTYEQALGFGGNPFNMTAAALRLAGKSNAVAKLHLETVDRMWHWVEDRCPIVQITNGVDMDWQFPEFTKANNPQALQSVKAKYKQNLLRYVKKRTGKEWQPDVLTIVYARRFQGYKRPDLIFMDWPWLEDLLAKGKLQIIFAGKPHPNDLPMINIFNEIYRKNLSTPNLVVLAGYEYALSKLLKAGADLWLQTSRRPQEACGTSWISANFMGTLVMFSLDGGILESVNMQNGFPFGVAHPWHEQDTTDFKDLKKVLEQATEMFYDDQGRWYARALAVKKDAENNFNSHRMLQEYIDSLYLS